MTVYEKKTESKIAELVSRISVGFGLLTGIEINVCSTQVKKPSDLIKHTDHHGFNFLLGQFLAKMTNLGPCCFAGILNIQRKYFAFGASRPFMGPNNIDEVLLERYQFRVAGSERFFQSSGVGYTTVSQTFLNFRLIPYYLRKSEKGRFQCACLSRYPSRVL